MATLTTRSAFAATVTAASCSAADVQTALNRAAAGDTVSIPAGTQNVNPTIQTQSGTATGVNVGVDLTYMFVKQVGAGAFMRYVSGSVDLDSAPNLKVGGFQIGLGGRLRF